MAEMKTLNGHEIVDAKARKRLDTLEKEGVGGGEGENLRILITKVDGGTGVSSHTAQAIYEADVAERVIEAVMDGYRYEYLGATHFAASGECDEVTFYRTMVENGKVMTEVVKIFDDGTATSETAEINPYNKDEVDQMVSAIPKFKVAVVTVHPTITEASLTTIYLVPSGADDQNLYTEWICVEDDSGARTWEKLGTQNLDLTGYVTEEELNAAVEAALAEAKESGEFKGEKGDPGKTPVKGIDYFDGNDGAPGKDGTVQIDPLFAESVEWLESNGDTTKLYILPDNRIYGYIYSDAGAPAYTNWLPVADTATRISGDDTTAGQNGYVSGVRLNSSGLLKAYSGYGATGFIPYAYQGTDDTIRIKGAALAANATYTQELCFYDSSHTFLGYAGFSGTDYEALLNHADNGLVGWYIEKDSNGEYTLIWKPAETNTVKNGTVDTAKIAFVRIGMGDFANAVITINEEITGDSGSTAGYRWAWTGNYLVSPADTSDVGTTRDYVKKRNTYIMPVPSGYCESKLTFTDLSTKVTEVFKSEANLAEMMRRFSALATAHPNYVKETLLGKDASNTYNIYKYEMDLPQATDTGVTSVMEKDKPVFIITAGLHGIEPDAVIEVYHFMRDLCENFVESDQLDYLRTNVKFVIVPISNPWGFVNGTYNNSNNVNLNKNFEHGFESVTGATNPQLNSGTAAYSEAEAFLLKSVFDTYKNAVFHLECHGKAGADNAYNDVIWFSLMQSLKSECVELCANSVIHQIGRRLYKMGYNPDKTEGGYITYYNLNGRPKDYTGTEYGMMSATMEGTGRMAVAGHSVFTKDEQRINCEALENFVLQVMGALNSEVITTPGGRTIFGYVDENNNIIVQGNLADGTYSVKYEMEDGTTVDIGDLVLDSNTYYSVTKNLTNCTVSNSATQVVAGGSYSATVTANSGYTLDSVSVTMGGSAVSVSGGVINIASVTGDIVITAVASEAVVEPSYTNLVPTITDIDLVTIYNGKGYKENTRVSVSGVSASNPGGYVTSDATLTGLMSLGNDGDVFHLRNAIFYDVKNGSYDGLIWYYDASGTLLNSGTIALPTDLVSTDVNGDSMLTMNHSKLSPLSGAAYIRFNITNPTGELIMTRNQLIPV